MPAIKMSMEEFQTGNEECNGICLACHEIQYGGCEPDARRYKCESCGARKVYGLEEALLMGRLDIEEDDEDERGDE
jgi:hypothetical protein